MAIDREIQLRLPQQDLAEPTVFAADPAAAQAWVGGLPLTNLGQTARLLFQALAELNRVRLNPLIRLGILEALRGSVLMLQEGLSRHYLNKPLVLPEQPRRVAQLSLAIQRHFSTGYMIAAQELAPRSQRLIGKSSTQTALAIYRALTEGSLNLLRNLQLYEPTESGFWLDQHRLYRLAMQCKVLKEVIPDSENGPRTIQQAYLRTLLLGCAKANQLRQEEMQILYRVLFDWSAQDLLVIDADTQASLFIVDIERDAPPIYRSLYRGTPTAFCLGLNTKPLIELITQDLLPKTQGNSVVEVGGFTLTNMILQHLHQAWSEVAERGFERREVNNNLEACFGLSAIHYFATDETEFSRFVHDVEDHVYSVLEDNPFLNPRSGSDSGRERDVWDNAFKSELRNSEIDFNAVQSRIQQNISSLQEQSATPKERFNRHPIHVIDASPGGYCLEWQGDVPAALKTGELLGLREPNSQRWNLAVVRWVRRLNSTLTRAGVELLSPAIEPCAARVILANGENSSWQRSLLLPEIAIVGQPETLITPRLPFREGNKITLIRGGDDSVLQLNRKLQGSNSYSQFNFRTIGKHEPAQPNADRNSPSLSQDPFDSLWNQL